jgi:predicted amidohydrolase YtcJ
MKLRKELILAIIISTLFTCIDKNRQMDLIIYNAIIYTADEDFTVRESVAVHGGKIIATGTDKDILGKYRAESMIDMNGMFMYPGLIDPHCHFFGYGQSLMNADLSGTLSFDHIIEIILQHHQDFPSDWLLGRGWDQNLWSDKSFPDKSRLDQVFPDLPVLLTRIDGHAAIANSEALRRANINPDTKVYGGEFIKGNEGLTGVLIDNAIDLVRKFIPPAGYEANVRALLNAQKECFAVGLTSIGDAGLDREVIMLMDSLQKSGDLKMRTYIMINPSEENFESFMYRGIYKTDYMNVRSVKLFADGALGSRGARMIDEYSDDPGNYGLLLATPEYLYDISRRAWEHGYQVNTHCIGDYAVRFMLDIYGNILGGKNERRWRIEHAQVVHPDDFELFGKFSIIPSVQTTHATSDMKWASQRIGTRRMQGAYAYRRLLDQNGWLPNGSDFPVENINPLYGFYAGIARKDFDGYPEGGFQIENSLTREQALRSMTIWAARANFEENEKGSIETGKFADFIVTDQDLMNVDIDQVPRLKIQHTYVGGKKVYSAPE